MKLYYFNPNNYGEEFFVMAENKKNACIYLYDFLTSQRNEHRGHYCIRKRDFLFNENKELKLGIKTTIDEYDVGEVIQSELS